MAAQSAKEKPHKKSHDAGIFANRKAADGEWGKTFIVAWIGGSANRIRKTAECGGTSSTRKGATPHLRKWQRKAHKKSHGAGIFANRKAADGEWGKKFIVAWTGGGAKRIRKTSESGSASSIRKGAIPRLRKW